MNDTEYKKICLYYDDLYSNISKCIYDIYTIEH